MKAKKETLNKIIGLAYALGYRAALEENDLEDLWTEQEWKTIVDEVVEEVTRKKEFGAKRENI